MAENNEIPIELQQIDDGTLIRPSGDIDLSRAPAFRGHIAEVFQGKPMRVIIDLSDVPYMDSSGVATLVEAMQLATRGSAKLVLVGLQERVRSIFEIARLDTVFVIATDMDAAEGL